MNRPCGLIHEILSTAAGICWAQGYPTRRIYKVEGVKYNKNKYRYFLNLNNKFLIVNNKYPFSSVQLRYWRFFVLNISYLQLEPKARSQYRSGISKTRAWAWPKIPVSQHSSPINQPL